jgi:farnesol dehydrogenase
VEQVNVEGLKNVIEAVKRTPSVTKLIYTSSYFAIGPSLAEGQAVDETQVLLYDTLFFT